MRKFIAVLIVILIFNANCFAIDSQSVQPDINAPSAILIERSTGTVLYEKNAHEILRPASVTKIMTLLLTMEAIDSGLITFDTVLTVSEHSANMGGSQVYLEPGEQMTVHEALKCIAVSSANDACVMIAEHISGSEESFVTAMNQRAEQLGMKDTHFSNCTGLDADGHVTTAYDISLMSKALLSYDSIRQYTTIWMDSIRDGAFGLSNTNKLVRYYDGCTGLKTGYTSNAGYCISASAMKNNMELIAVIMHSDTSANRNADASSLLNFGFAQYALYIPQLDLTDVNPILINNGTQSFVNPTVGNVPSILVKKSDVSTIDTSIRTVEQVDAPVDKGQKVGVVSVKLGDRVLAEYPILSSEDIERKSISDYLSSYLAKLFMR